jgi:hypothetical protein
MLYLHRVTADWGEGTSTGWTRTDGDATCERAAPSEPLAWSPDDVPRSWTLARYRANGGSRPWSTPGGSFNATPTASIGPRDFTDGGEVLFDDPKLVRLPALARARARLTHHASCARSST